MILDIILILFHIYTYIVLEHRVWSDCCFILCFESAKGPDVCWVVVPNHFVQCFILNRNVSTCCFSDFVTLKFNMIYSGSAQTSK